MENPDKQRLESDLKGSFSYLKDLPRIESISKEIDAGTRYYFDEDYRGVSFRCYRAHIYQCPDCDATILIEFVDRDGSSSADRGLIECPNCERSTVTLKSAGWESRKILRSKEEGEKIIKEFEDQP